MPIKHYEVDAVTSWHESEIISRHLFSGKSQHFSLSTRLA